MNLKKKIFLSYFLLAVVPVALLAFVVSYFLEDYLKEQTLTQLDSIAKIQQQRVDDAFKSMQQEMSLISSRTQMRISFEKYTQSADKKHIQKVGKIVGDAMKSAPTIRDIHILDTSGKVQFSTDTNFQGIIQTKKAYFKSGSKDFTVENFFAYDDEILVRVASPLILKENIIGVIAVDFTTAFLKSIVDNYQGLGDTGETILIKRLSNNELICIFPMRFRSEASLSKIFYNKDNSVFNLKSFQSKGLTQRTDYRDKIVLASRAHVDIADVSIIVKRDEGEVFSILEKLRLLVLVLTGFCLCLY